MRKYCVLFILILSITSLVYGQEKINPSMEFEGSFGQDISPPSPFVAISQSGDIAWENWHVVYYKDRSISPQYVYFVGRISQQDGVLYLFPPGSDVRLLRPIFSFDGEGYSYQKVGEEYAIDMTTDNNGILYIMTETEILTRQEGQWDSIIPGDWDMRYNANPGEQKISVTPDGQYLAVGNQYQSYVYRKLKTGAWVIDTKNGPVFKNNLTDRVLNVYLSKTETGYVTAYTNYPDDGISLSLVNKEDTTQKTVGTGIQGPFHLIDDLLIAGNLIYRVDTLETEYQDGPVKNGKDKAVVELKADLDGRAKFSDVDAVWKKDQEGKVLLVALSAEGDYSKGLPNKYWTFEAPIPEKPKIVEKVVPNPVIDGKGQAFWQGTTTYTGESTDLTLVVVTRPKTAIDEILVDGVPIKAARNKGGYFRPLKGITEDTLVEVSFRKWDRSTEDKILVELTRDDAEIVGLKTPKWRENPDGSGYRRYLLLPGKYQVTVGGQEKVYTLLVRKNGNWKVRGLSLP